MSANREAVIRECWERINALIVPGPLPGNGTDQTAQRNGLILASNVLHEMALRAAEHTPSPPRPLPQAPFRKS